MNSTPAVSLVDFEVYLLLTMKLRIKMSHKEAQLQAKLAEHGFSLASAEKVHDHMVEALGDEASYFDNMKQLVPAASANTYALEYRSALWPGFTFKATADDDGQIESAGYWHTSRNSSDLHSPIDAPIWSMDVTEFTERFGPTNPGRRWPISDKLLPAYEEHEFQWNGSSFGAGFSWGLFIFAAMSWD